MYRYEDEKSKLFTERRTIPKMDDKTAIMGHRLMWNVLTLNPDFTKPAAITRLRVYEPDLNIPPSLKNDCFLCENASGKMGKTNKHYCEYCLGVWPGGKCYYAYRNNGLFDRWRMAGGCLDLRSKLAAQIRDIPMVGEKEKKEDDKHPYVRAKMTGSDKYIDGHLRSCYVTDAFDRTQVCEGMPEKIDQPKTLMYVGDIIMYYKCPYCNYESRVIASYKTMGATQFKCFSCDKKFWVKP